MKTICLKCRNTGTVNESHYCTCNYGFSLSTWRLRLMKAMLDVSDQQVREITKISDPVEIENLRSDFIDWFASDISLTYPDIQTAIKEFVKTKTELNPTA